MAYERNRPGATFTQQSTLSPETMMLLHRFYLTMVDEHMKSADATTYPSAIRAMFAITVDFWASIRMKVPKEVQMRTKLDTFFYGTAEDIDYTDSVAMDKVRDTFSSRAQASVVMRDIWKIASEYGITMDYSYILEGYENFGRV